MVLRLPRAEVHSLEQGHPALVCPQSIEEWIAHKEVKQEWIRLGGHRCYWHESRSLHCTAEFRQPSESGRPWWARVP
jgi:hypothetical protein